MPGFGGGDQTLVVLAAWLRRIGYRPRTCGFVANAGCADRAVDRVEQQLDKLHGRYGRRVALIGHSRGGDYARALGQRHPELVSHAISIGAGLRQMLAISYPTQLLAGGARRVVLRSGASSLPAAVRARVRRPEPLLKPAKRGNAGGCGSCCRRLQKPSGLPEHCKDS